METSHATKLSAVRQEIQDLNEKLIQAKFKEIALQLMKNGFDPAKHEATFKLKDNNFLQCTFKDKN